MTAVKFTNADDSFTNHRVCDKDAWMNAAGGHDGAPLRTATITVDQSSLAAEQRG